ncbi:hypothetical protein L1887_58246 [Cichorium endivia]|nr:hypothetical protein L1887_58246 [Cichorium endivia]
MRGGQEDFSVLLVEVAEALEAEVDGDVVLVWQCKGDVGDRLVGSVAEDGLAHAVHGGLHTCRVVECKDAQHVRFDRVVDVAELGQRSRLLERGAESALGKRDRVGALDFGGEDAVAHLLECGEAVPVEAVEGAAAALEHEQTLDAALERGHLDLAASSLAERAHGALLLAVTHKAVLVRAAILGVEHDARPLVLDQVHFGLFDVRVGSEEVVDDVQYVSLGAQHVLCWQHLGEVVERVLDRVRGDDGRVVGLGVRRSEALAMEQASHRVLGDAVRRGVLAVAHDAEDAHEVLAIRRGRQTDVG